MNSSNFRFTLDLNSAQSQVAIPVTLGDTARTWYISLSDGGMPYIIAEGCTARVEIKRPNGTHLVAYCSIEKKTTIKYAFSQNINTAAEEGVHNCSVIIEGADGYRIGSPKFSMIVYDRVIDSDDFNITDDQQTAIDDMITAEASRQEAEIARINAESARIAAEKKRETDNTARQTKLDEALVELDEALEEVAEVKILGNNIAEALGEIDTLIGEGV
jgi:hypothetical protein